MKTLIAVPTMDTVPAQFAHSLAVLEKVDEVAVAFQVGSLIYAARNDLAQKAIEFGADQVLWLDSDMIFQPDTLKKLIANKDKGDIISGLYFRRVSPFTPVIFDKLDIGEQGTTFTEFTEIPDEPFEVGGCGFGCVLTPTEIFIDVLNTYRTCFEPLKGAGEDLSFCWRARQRGYKIICDPSIKLGHVGHFVINEAFYKSFNAGK